MLRSGGDGANTWVERALPAEVSDCQKRWLHGWMDDPAADEVSVLTV